MKKNMFFFRFFIPKYSFYKCSLMLRESEEYFQIVDMPRVKDPSLAKIYRNLRHWNGTSRQWA